MLKHRDLVCPICNGACSQLAPVDFNKSCEEVRGNFLKPAGILVFYALCNQCGFCFAPELANWTLQEFEEKIYNDDYKLVDPDYSDARPRSTANLLISMFGDKGYSISHLDYGGGKGLLATLLREAHWKSSTYDPLVDKTTKIDQLGKFDLITAFEVFEHVSNVHTLMSDICTLLAPKGVVLFSTLVSDGHIEGDQELNWWYASPRNGHISLYSKRSLAILAKASGFNFGSFSEGLHVFVNDVPSWAEHIILAR